MYASYSAHCFWFVFFCHTLLCSVSFTHSLIPSLSTPYSVRVSFIRYCFAICIRFVYFHCQMPTFPPPLPDQNSKQQRCPCYARVPCERASNSLSIQWLFINISFSVFHCSVCLLYSYCYCCIFIAH